MKNLLGCMVGKQACIALAGLVFVSVAASGAEIIPFARRVTWQGNVGIPGGVPDSSKMTVFANFTSSATLAQVQASLQSCPSNQVVHLAAGTYSWAGDLDYQSIGDGKVLKGDVDANGVPTTKIMSSSGVVLIRSQSSETALSTEANLTVNGNKGDTTITLASVPSWVTVGDCIGIDQLDDTSLSFNPGQESGTSYREITGNGPRGMAQLLKVTATTSTTITFDLPLAWTFSTANTAQIFQPLRDLTAGRKTRKRCGVENIIWEHTGTPTTGHMVKMETAEECWLKNFYGTNIVGGIYVFGVGSYRCEIRHCRFDDSKALSGGQGYGIGLYHFNTGWLIEDNIFRKLHVGMQNNYGSCYNVFAYNFETDGQSTSGQNPGMSGHGTTGYMTLFEGNWCMDKYLGDFTHGAGCYYTLFRNRIVGKNPAQTSDQTAISNERYNRKMNIAGNLLGDAAWHTVYMAAPSGGGYVGSQSTCVGNAIYKMGYWANWGCDATATDSFATMDPIIAVNYDVVTKTNSGIVLGGFATGDLVSSYYLSSKPAFFGTLAWPPFSPTAVSAAAMDRTNLPAGYRFVTGRETPSGPVNLAPNVVATASTKSGPAPLSVVFSSIGSSDPEGVALTYTWTFGDATTSTAANPSHTYSTAGNYAARLTVSDGTNTVSSTNLNITVTVAGQNLAPAAFAGTPTPSGVAPLLVSFSSAGSSDPEGAALTYNWAFGDGATAATANPTHTYPSSGVFVAQLTVSDGTNTSSPAAVTITVGSAANSLVAAYGFEEGSGPGVTDVSGNANNGTINGATRAAGKFGSGLSFSGAGDMVTVGDAASLDLTTAMTLEAWVYPTALGGWRDVIFKDTDIYFLMGSTTQGTPAMGGTFASANAAGTAALPLNTWTHLAGTYDGTTMRLYANGVLVASRAQTGGIASSTGALSIGGDGTAGQYWAGMIDEVRIYSRALSAGEILADMNTAITATSPKPLAPGATVIPRIISATTPKRGAAPLTVGFVAGADWGANYWLNFGDGNTNANPNSTHIYGTAGTYNLSVHQVLAGNSAPVVTYAGYIVVTNAP